VPRNSFDRILPILPTPGVPVLVLLRGNWASFMGVRKRNGTWTGQDGTPISQLITGWEYADGKARGRFRGSRIIGIFVILKPETKSRRPSIEKLVVVTSQT